MSDNEKVLKDAYYWLSTYKLGAITEGVAMERIKDAILEQPQLNENQQIVLDLLKIWQEKWPSWSVSTVIEYLLEQQNEYHQMLSKQEEAQVLQVFSQWVLEQEEE